MIEKKEEKIDSVSRKEKMAKIIHQVQEANPNLILGGSCSLVIRELRNLAKDIDFSVPSGQKIIIPQGFVIKEIGDFDYGGRLICKAFVDGITVDFLRGTGRYEEIDGIKVTRLQELVKEKVIYIKDNSTTKSDIIKHINDIETITQKLLNERKNLRDTK